MPQVTSTPCRLLVVDDNRDTADSLALLLQLQGHEVHAAYDGPSALQKAKQLAPRLIFLDLGLPGMSGYEVAEQLKKSPELCDVPLVALTGFGSEEDLQRSKEAGFVAHLVKPLDPSSLDKVISELI